MAQEVLANSKTELGSERSPGESCEPFKLSARSFLEPAREGFRELDDRQATSFPS